MKRPEWIPFGLSILAFALFWIFAKDFRDIPYLIGNTTIFAETGLLAIGMTLIIISGNIDLSVGSILVLTACLVPKLVSNETPVPVAVVVAVAIGTLLGAINGILITKAKLPSFLVTLATMALYRGIAMAMLQANSAEVPKVLKGIDRGSLLGMPYTFLIFLFFALVVGLVLHRMVLGRWFLGIGTNPEAARYAGFPVHRATIAAFAITGGLIGIAALCLDSRLGVARPDMSTGIELQAITIVVAGGTAISGGKGTMIGTLLSWMLMYFVSTGMGVMNVKAEYQLTIIGLILILSVFGQQVATTIASQRLHKQTKLSSKQ